MGLAPLEPIPVDPGDAEDVAAELRELSRACRRMNRDVDHILGQLRAQSHALAREREPSASMRQRLLASDEVKRNAEDIANRSDRFLGRIDTSFNLTTPPAPPDRPLPTIPHIRPTIDQEAMTPQLDAVTKAFAQSMIDWVRPLHDAINAVEARSSSWSTPYAKQLHLEVGRLKSRLTKLSP